MPTTLNRKQRPLSITDVSRILRRLEGTLNGQPSRVGYVCSSSWAEECFRSLATGKVKQRKKLERIEHDLHRAGVYPPGGSRSAMIENERTLRYVPPDITNSPIDEREDTMSFTEGLRMPPSVSSIAIQEIRAVRAKPIGGRFRYTSN